MKNAVKIFSALAVLSLMSSCGDSGSGGGGSKNEAREQREIAPEDGSNIEGHFQAKFKTLNPHVNGTIPGSANFYRKEEKIYAFVRLFAGGVRAWHMQHVYTGSRCPSMNDDTNLDGFIDIQEAEKVLGKILIPLDSDISSQSSGRRFFPLADLSGYYHYERITNFSRFLNDLQNEDNDPEDDLVKLPPGEGLQLEGRAVLVQGVAETITLPETVGSKGRHRAFQTLPIVCGIFKKVEKIPGEPYTLDEIPGPIGEVIEGQDRPADDDIPDTTGSTSGGSTGSNDSDDGDGPTSDGNGNVTGGGTSGGNTTGGSTGTSGTSGSSDSTSTSGTSSSGSSTGSSTGGTDTSSTTGSSSTTGGTSTTGTTTSGQVTSGTSSGTTGSSSTTTTTTTDSSTSSSSSSSSTGTTTGGFLDSSSGV